MTYVVFLDRVLNTRKRLTKRILRKRYTGGGYRTQKTIGENKVKETDQGPSSDPGDLRECGFEI